MKTQFYLTSAIAVMGLAFWAYQDSEAPLSAPGDSTASARAMGELRETLAAQVRLLSRQTTFPSEAEIAANLQLRSEMPNMTGRTDAPIHPNDRTAPGLHSPRGLWKETR